MCFSQTEQLSQEIREQYSDVYSAKQKINRGEIGNYGKQKKINVHQIVIAI